MLQSHPPGRAAGHLNAPGLGDLPGRRARPEGRRLRPGLAAAAAFAAPSALRGDRGGGGAGRGGRLPRPPAQDPGDFNKSSDSYKAPGTCTQRSYGEAGRVHLAEAMQPPAEGVASTQVLSWVDLKGKEPRNAPVRFN